MTLFIPQQNHVKRGRYRRYDVDDMTGAFKAVQEEDCSMGDYRYTELSYKITSLIAHTCCLGSSGLTYT